MKKKKSTPPNNAQTAANDQCPPVGSPIAFNANASGVPETDAGNDTVADTSTIDAKGDRPAGAKQDAARSSYEKLVKPQNYHEYMRASKFRGNR